MSRANLAPLSWAALLAAAFFFLGLTIAAPILAARGNGLAAWIYLAFDPVCHQLSERSFHIDGHALAVCHRCFGLYSGALVGLLVVPLWTSARDWLLAEPRRIALFLVPMALDWALLSHNIPLSRFFTGVLAAAPVAVLVFIAHDQLTTPRGVVEPGEPA